MRRVLFVVLFLCGGLGSLPAAAELFTDDFNRSDGPLGPPWELLDQSPLYIVDQRVQAQADEYGLMVYDEQCPDCYCAYSTLQADFGFSADTGYDGRFQFFIGGGESGSHYWGFIAKVGLDEISIWRYDDSAGEVLLSAEPSPLQHARDYTFAMAYTPDPPLLVTAVGEGGPAVYLSMLPVSSEPFCYGAIGIENLGATGDTGWLDNVLFEYCCEPTGVDGLAGDAPLRASPSPFTDGVDLRAASPGGAEATVAIFDVTGRRVDTVTLAGGAARWEATDLPAGLYLARLVDSPDAPPVRLVKLH